MSLLTNLLENDIYGAVRYKSRQIFDKNNAKIDEKTYINAPESFKPIGILCEEVLSIGEIWLSKELNIPLCFRKKRIDSIDKPEEFVNKYLNKQYGLEPNKKRFFIEH